LIVFFVESLVSLDINDVNTILVALDYFRLDLLVAINNGDLTIEVNLPAAFVSHNSDKEQRRLASITDHSRVLDEGLGDVYSTEAAISLSTTKHVSVFSDRSLGDTI
jgi:hypothetical protein